MSEIENRKKDARILQCVIHQMESYVLDLHAILFAPMINDERIIDAAVKVHDDS